ncbi:MAG: molybdenum cofactor guanylyltransferase [Gammaproteobacteria bacterium]|nr:molybdenum cofactor guanylyltransferase [Gammaproteobacteria bacterium]OUV67961.1 MAG: molybdenum cofactor guanylyltransferase [Gammaproteobacteria bacterium TMED133]
MNTSNITGIILAGGASRRMNGKDKAWLSYRGKPLIRHVIDNIEPQVDEIILSYSENTKNYQSLPYASYRDYKLGFQGPLTGILSCSKYVSTPFVFIAPCDMPLLPRDIIPRLEAQIENNDIVVPNDGIREQCLVFLTKTKILNSIDQYLKSNKKSVQGWIAQQSRGTVDFSTESKLFKNINTGSQLI